MKWKIKVEFSGLFVLLFFIIVYLMYVIIYVWLFLFREFCKSVKCNLYVLSG